MKNNLTQRGYSLLELMIAMALGLFLIAIIVTIYLGAQSTFRTTSQISRTQETTRFATNFLATDIRMAGFASCADSASKRNNLNDQNPAYIPSMQYGIFGWEFTGTDIGETYPLNYDLPDSSIVTNADLTALRASNTAGAGSWTSQFRRQNMVTPTDVTLPNVIAGLSPLVGSDIIAISIATPLENLTVQSQTPAAENNPVLTLVDFNANRAASGIENGQIVRIGDCTALDLFQNTAQPGDSFVQIDDSGLSPGNDFFADFAWQKSWNESSTIYTVDTRVYFVGTGANGTPSLFRYTSSCGINNNCNPETVELIEGVENLQVLYGQSSGGDDKTPNSYLSADQVTDYANISSVKLGLLMRSPNQGSSSVASDATYELNGTTTIDPPNESNLRFMTNTTIHLRNSGI